LKKKIRDSGKRRPDNSSNGHDPDALQKDRCKLFLQDALHNSRSEPVVICRAASLRKTLPSWLQHDGFWRVIYGKDRMFKYDKEIIVKQKVLCFRYSHNEPER